VSDQRLDVYDAGVPVLYGFVTLLNTATLDTPNEIAFNGSDVNIPGTNIALANPSLPRCGRYRLASLQIMPSDSLLTQQEYFVTVRAQGADLNTGVMAMQSGVTYYPGTLIGTAWDLILGAVCHNLTATTTNAVRLIAGVVRVDQRPGSI
jgi:hypothetical protein